MLQCHGLSPTSPNSTPWTAYATCLRMIAKFYGKTYSNQFLREKSFITREGVSLLGIFGGGGKHRFAYRVSSFAYFPLLSQVIVDKGIGNNNLPFITLVLVVIFMENFCKYLYDAQSTQKLQFLRL
ncbi:MAG: hypothetical protein LBS01_09490 [Prevotellaceae bacterium]|nr:hypothetical protein [Prevotellaceae bacterium]